MGGDSSPRRALCSFQAWGLLSLVLVVVLISFFDFEAFAGGAGKIEQGGEVAERPSAEIENLSSRSDEAGGDDTASDGAGDETGNVSDSEPQVGNEEDEEVEAAAKSSENEGAGESTSRKLSAMGGSPWTAPEWPPAHCKGVMFPASSPKVKGESRIMVKGSRRRLLTAGGDKDGENVGNVTLATVWKLRKLLSEAPTELVLDKKPPDPEFRNQVYGFLRNFMASPEPCTLGNCPVAGPNGEDGKPPVSPWPCIFKTKNEACKAAKPGKHATPPALYKGSLGRCAFIGTGEQLLQGEFGTEIDAHDSVIRYNNPIKGFEKHVGTKTTLMWVKGHYKTTAKPTLGYFDAKVSLPKDANVYDVDTELGMRPMRSLRNDLVNLWLKRNKIKDGKPAAGLMRTQMLIKSGYCTSIDLYGFSTRGSVRSGKYFDKKAIVTKGHTIDWDGWILSAMMDLGYICVYGQ